MEIARTSAQPEEEKIDFSDKFIKRNVVGKREASATSTNLQSTGKITPLELDLGLDDLTKNDNQINDSDNLMGMSDHNNSTEEAARQSENEFIDSNDSLSDNSGKGQNADKNKGAFLIENILATQNKEKYLKLFDMIEVLLENIENDISTHGDIVKVFIDVLESIDEADIERSVSLLYDKDKSEVLFMIASLLTQRNHLTDQYEFLVLTMYVDAIHRGDLHFAMRVLLSYEDLVLRNDKKVL